GFHVTGVQTCALPIFFVSDMFEEGCKLNLRDILLAAISRRNFKSCNRVFLHIALPQRPDKTTLDRSEVIPPARSGELVGRNPLRSEARRVGRGGGSAT